MNEPTPKEPPRFIVWAWLKFMRKEIKAGRIPKPEGKRWWKDVQWVETPKPTVDRERAK